MSQTAKPSSEKSNQAGSSTANSQSVVKGLWGVRYQVKDVNRSVNFYTQQLGLKLDHQNLPAFAQVSVGNLKLILMAQARRVPAQCPMGDSKSRVDGIE